MLLRHFGMCRQCVRDGGQICIWCQGQLPVVMGSGNFPRNYSFRCTASRRLLETRVFSWQVNIGPDIWYEVAKPEDGQRANVISFTPTFVLCRTVKARKSCHDSVQQSDYIHTWAAE